MSDPFLEEARRLFALGAGIHWIRPHSKAPVKAEWSAPIRDSLEMVERDYRLGYGLGVRLGHASHCIDGGYLANIDVDIKSADPRHRTEALAFLEQKYPGIKAKAPWVKTGYGYRYFVRTKEPVSSKKLGASPEECLVLMPTSAVNRRQEAAVAEGRMSAEQLKAGYRVRPAWELELMSAGKQVVLPPSIHPDTGAAYTWGRGFRTTDELPYVDTTGLRAASRVGGKGRAAVYRFEPVVVDLIGECGLTDAAVDAIISGKGVDNRSDKLMSVAIAMLKAKWTDDMILSVLTDRNNYLGVLGYERRGDCRWRAAAWVKEHTLDTAKIKVLPENVFADAVEVTTVLSDEEAAAQKAELVGDRAPADQELTIKYNQKGGVLKSLSNLVTIFSLNWGTDIFKEDLFSNRYFYGNDNSPWGKTDGEYTPRERPLIAHWLSEKYRYEASQQDILDAVKVIGDRNAHHPLLDYLNGLVWDGKSRIDTWLRDYMGAHDVNELYLREVSRKVLAAMIARVYEPGCQFDYMLVLKGPQGLGKSRSLEALAGKKYYSCSVVDPSNKDTIQKMESKWIMEFGELSNVRADVRALKNFITMSVDRDRMVYNNMTQDYPRKCIFVGTTNADDFMYDETGGRRFWPVSVGDIDVEGITRNRDQFLAEAKVLYDCGEALYLSGDAEAAAKHEQSRWVPEDALTDRVQKILERNKTLEENHLEYFPPEGFKLSHILERMERDDPHTQNRVGRSLRALKYIKKTTRQSDGQRGNLWFSQ